MRELVYVLAPIVFTGGPALVLGLLAGGRVRRWRWAAVLVGGAFVLAVVLLGMIPDDPDDDDPGLAYAIGALINLVAWTIGVVGGTAARRRALRRSA